jgi:hypothetical protein
MFLEPISFLVPAADGVLVLTLRHLSVVETWLLDTDGAKHRCAKLCVMH